jgi:hypothetical protein
MTVPRAGSAAEAAREGASASGVDGVKLRLLKLLNTGRNRKVDTEVLPKRSQGATTWNVVA